MATDEDPSEESDAHTAFDCAECDLQIRPGDSRVPSIDGSLHVVCEARRAARQRYRFYIAPHEDGVAYALTYNDGDRDHPICYNTGGISCISSTDPRFGNGPVVPPSNHFFQAIAYTFHWLLSYRPLRHDTERIEQEIEEWLPRNYPNGKVPDQEWWAAKILLKHMYRSRFVPREFREVVECCDRVTAFRTPEVASLD